MDEWRPSSRSYLIDYRKFPTAREICITDIAPVRRNLSHGVFNNDSDTGLPARDRVIRLLRGFKEGALILPVEMEERSSAPYSYSLYHGAHRLYLSIAAGFTHVPATFEVPSGDW
jgi:hypothetical protein